MLILRIYRQLRSKKPGERLELLALIASWVLPTYRFKWPMLDWWENSSFNEYLVEFNEMPGYNTDRRWMLSELLRLVEGVEGDTAECGVFEGSSSYLICKANASLRKNGSRVHYMFDSFEGLSAPSQLDGQHWSSGDLSSNEEVLLKKLSGFSNIKVMKGWIPERFTEIADRNFAFVHIDVDLYQPTFDSLQFFYDRMNSGGIILCDDYGCSTCPGATLAFEEFLRDKTESMIALSGGGGFMIKGVETSASNWPSC
jgi:hypothetical protein